jgi:glutamyl-tRNA reductase
MVQGESEILGQVKTAHRQAWSDGTAQTTLNILFRDAVTAAKKIKTQVTHPSAPVSVATLAAKRVLDFKKLPTVLLVGSSGQIGTSVLKNLCAAGRCKILAPLRTRRCASREEVLYQHPNLTYMSYDDRFRALEIVDVVVSATASPHYVFTSRDSLPHIDATKPYLFLDLAIPLDVDPSLAELENITLEDIDSFKKLSAHNNRLRRRQNKEAVSQIDHYVDVFAKKQIFMRNRSLIAQLDRRIEQVADRMSPTAVIHNLIFNVRENTAPETFEIFMNCLSPEIQQRYFPPPQDGPECPDPVAVATSTADLMSGE